MPRLLAYIEHDFGQENELLSNYCRNGGEQVLAQLATLHVFEHAAENLVHVLGRLVLDLKVEEFFDIFNF